MIKVLVVDDSTVARESLVYLLNADPDIQVIGTARNSEEACAAIQSVRPDVVTMDIHLPVMNGFQTTRRIMETCPTPIVIVSRSNDHGSLTTTFRAVEAGALAVVAQPPGIDDPDHAAMAQELIRTIKLMSEVKVVRRWAHLQGQPAKRTAPAAPEVRYQSAAGIKCVAIGASTGGPAALQTILANLPAAFPAPLLIVQHMTPGFIAGLVAWLAQASGWPIHIVKSEETPLAGHAYIAPDGFQMKVASSGRLVLTQDAPENGVRPSVSYLFRSVACTYGPAAAGVLLTGMGKDGAHELRMMREKGAVTLAQDRASAVVHGMAGEAIRLDAASYVLPPLEIAAALAALIRPQNL
jgi:two-component system chemotaxis response regulator CheB